MSVRSWKARRNSKPDCRRQRAQEDTFGVSMTVLGELYYAVYASQRKQENLARLKAFLDSVILWEYDRPAAEEFGRIQAEQKTKGKPIPSSDAQIAAVARLHNLKILSNDRHFTFVSNLAIESWLSS
ncbi:MAG: PIN domain-containing protein [Chloroflexota bacterium]|nr:PIN domain-containing protein [Chloroflexota bacterium]